MKSIILSLLIQAQGIKYMYSENIFISGHHGGSVTNYSSPIVSSIISNIGPFHFLSVLPPYGWCSVFCKKKSTDLPIDDPIIKKPNRISNIFHTPMDGIIV